jgi:hypothetical protein
MMPISASRPAAIVCFILSVSSLFRVTCKNKNKNKNKTNKSENHTSCSRAATCNSDVAASTFSFEKNNEKTTIKEFICYLFVIDSDRIRNSGLNKQM